jgi:hypothetical protein
MEDSLKSLLLIKKFCETDKNGKGVNSCKALNWTREKGPLISFNPFYPTRMERVFKEGKSPSKKNNTYEADELFLRMVFEFQNVRPCNLHKYIIDNQQ